MVDTAAETEAPDNPARLWLAEIARSEKKYKEWHTQGDKVIRRYKGERANREMVTGRNASGRRMNLLWSTVETTKPAYFSQLPNPNVSARAKDSDAVTRWAAIVLERALETALDTQDFEHTMRSCVQDMLLPGRGMAIVEYKPTIEADEADPNADTPVEGEEAPEPKESVTDQKVILRYIHWKDLLTNIARIWEEVWWEGYRVFQARSELIENFGADIGNAITLDHRERDGMGRFTGSSLDAKATIWTVWDKRKNRVIQVAPGYPEKLLDDMAPPVKFAGFFPMPRPISATLASDSIIPVPDFAMYQDQADEIDLLTTRIYKLTESLKLRGLYPGDLDAVKRLLSDASDTEMIPVDNWAMLAERGGAAGLVLWFPLKEVATTLATCYEARDKAKGALYEITGLADIIRGATDPNETATAQGIKSQWGALRIRDRQRDIQRFVRDALRLMAEVMAEHFSEQTFRQMTGVKLLTADQKAKITQIQDTYQQHVQQIQAQSAQQAPAQPAPNYQQAAPPQLIHPNQQMAGVPTQPMGASQTAASGQMQQPGNQAMAQPQIPPPPKIPKQMLDLMTEPTWDDVMALLKNDKLRSFAIDVETDSTIEPDQTAEQEQASQFITAMTQFLTASGPILMQEPGAAPMLGKIMVFGARRFKVSDDIETAIEKFAETVGAQAGQGGGKPPDPRIAIEQAKLSQDAAHHQAEQQTEQMKMQAQAADDQRQAQLLQEKEAAAAKLESQRFDADQSLAQTKLQTEAIEKEKDRQHEREQNERERQHKSQLARIAARAAKVAKTEGGEVDDPVGDADGSSGSPQETMDDQPDGGDKLLKAIEGATNAMMASAQATAQMGADIKQAIMAENEIVRDPMTGKVAGSRKRQENFNG